MGLVSLQVKPLRHIDVKSAEGDATTRLLGLDIPLVRLFAWEASAPIKLAVALARAKHA
jgi:hypothetical protein